MSEAEKRLHRCCFTGHRPNKLGMNEETIRAWLRTAIEEAIEDGYRTFLSGMCWGVDIIAAELVLECKHRYDNIHLICALPHPNFEVKWHRAWQARYWNVLQQADMIKIVSDEYSEDAYQTRNKWMCNHSHRIICVYTGAPGGTRNTINYALQEELEIVSIDDNAISNLRRLQKMRNP